MRGGARKSTSPFKLAKSMHHNVPSPRRTSGEADEIRGSQQAWENNSLFGPTISGRTSKIQYIECLNNDR